MKQEIVKIKDSAAVIIPRKLLRRADLDIGDEVEIKINEGGSEIKIKPSDKELIDWTEDFIKRYRFALGRLSQK